MSGPLLRRKAMKKLIVILFSLFFVSSIYAHGVEWFGTSIIKDNKWTPLQISLWPVHLCDPASNVYGIAVSPGLVGGVKSVYGISCGIIFLQDENNGLTAGIFPAGTKNNGLSVGAVNTWKHNNGVCVGAANFIDDPPGGNMLQIGVFNYAKNGLQIGLLNYNPNALIPWMPIFNWSAQSSPEKTQKK